MSAFADPLPHGGIDEIFPDVFLVRGSFRAGPGVSFGRNMIVTPEQWANIMSYADNGRPIYIAANPQNAGGALTPTSLRGNVAGLDLRVSRYMQGSGGVGTADYSMAVINPDAYTWYEGARQQLRTNINSDGTVDILLFGQGALATKLAAGANWFNLT